MAFNPDTQRLSSASAEQAQHPLTELWVAFNPVAKLEPWQPGVRRRVLLARHLLARRQDGQVEPAQLAAASTEALARSVSLAAKRSLEEFGIERSTPPELGTSEAAAKDSRGQLIESDSNNIEPEAIAEPPGAEPKCVSFSGSVGSGGNSGPLTDVAGPLLSGSVAPAQETSKEETPSVEPPLSPLQNGAPFREADDPSNEMTRATAWPFGSLTSTSKTIRLYWTIS